MVTGVLALVAVVALLLLVLVELAVSATMVARLDVLGLALGALLTYALGPFATTSLNCLRW